MICVYGGLYSILFVFVLYGLFLLACRYEYTTIGYGCLLACLVTLLPDVSILQLTICLRCHKDVIGFPVFDTVEWPRAAGYSGQLYCSAIHTIDSIEHSDNVDRVRILDRCH